MSELSQQAQGLIFEEGAPKTFLMYQFPDQKKKIAALSYDEKMEWYSSRDAKDMIFLGNDPDFKRFWKWHVVIPMKFKRFYYRLKNGEVFKKYEHITEMKKKVKKHSI